MNRLKQVIVLLLVLAMTGQMCLTSYAAAVPEGPEAGQIVEEEQQEEQKQEEQKQEELQEESPLEEVTGEEQEAEESAEGTGEEDLSKEDVLETETEVEEEETVVTSVQPLAVEEEVPETVEPSDSEQPRSWDYSKSKTATNLDSSFESKVTLSLPSAEEQLVSDVVFVLDKSTSPSIEKQITDMLQALKDQMKDTDAVIRVGVVIFNKQANSMLPLTELNDTNMAAITAAIETEISSGTNLHAGLLAGKAMLDQDQGVDAGRKYLVVVSDGITYMYNEEPTAVAWSFWADALKNWAGPDNWYDKYDKSNNPPENWGKWMETIAAQIKADGSTYEYPYGGTPVNSTPLEEASLHANSVDKALYLSASVYQEAVDAGYHCFSVCAETGKGEAYIWGPSFMEYLSRLSGTTGYDFSEIQNDILYFLDAGSYVEDYMGYVEGDYNFDLVNDASALSMKVGNEIFSAELIEENHYGFGKDANGSYRYELTYEPGDKQGTEHFTWLTHVPVKNSERVQLTYTVKLMNPKKAGGKYGTYDADGSKNYAGLYTNNSAVLYPKASDGQAGNPEIFGKPTVSYTVPTLTPSQPSGSSGSSGHHSSSKTVEAPKTGDNSLTGFWIILAFAAAVGLGYAARFRRKFRR